MQHPVFGPIEQDNMGGWRGRVRLPFFAGHDLAAAASAGFSQNAPDERYRQGDFELWLIGPDRSAPSVRQERAFRRLLDSLDPTCNRVVEAIFNLYQVNWASWRGQAEPGQAGAYADELLIPELDSRDGLRNVIRLEVLSVLDVPEHGHALLGFCFLCTWDVEHGLGVLVRDGSVIEIGENDVTWSAPEFAGQRGALPEAATSRQIDENRGIAAIKRLGGSVGAMEAVKPGEPMYVTHVDLRSNRQLNDPELRVLRHFTQLRQLELASPRITDAGLSELRELKTLRILELSGTGITDSGLGYLRELRDLKVLQLSGTQITDLGMKEIHEIKKLTLLHLTGTRITDAGLKELRDHKMLAALHLNDTNVTDAGMQELRALTSLQHLELCNTRVTDAWLRDLNQLRRLRTLDLSGTAITDTGLKEFQSFTSLRVLDLSRTGVSDKGLGELCALQSELQSLRTLKLRSTAVTDNGMSDLKRALPELQVIS
jgi:hypothetical protein